jgi:hypothetical protein
MREQLINAIVDLSSDELQTEDYISMAKESEETLVARLVNIAYYYKDQSNEE